MSTTQNFPITPLLAGQTVAAVLRHCVGGLSWTEVRRLIAARRVRVNGGVCLDDARRLKEGEALELQGESGAAPPPELEVRIVYRDADLVVVEKPAGVQTVRRAEERDWSEERKRRQPVLQEMVGQMLAAAPGSRGQAPRIRAVHRLDRDTSGLMMFALSARAEQELVRRLAHHDILRVYWAVVHGIMTGPRTLETWLVRDRGDGLRGSAADPAPPDAQRAVTHVRPIERLGPAFTIVECRLETGRTHQIRIHLAEIGHRVCGERVYVPPGAGTGVIADTSNAPRQALHSAQLELQHPITGKVLKFESKWPRDLARWIESVGRQK